MAKFIIYCLYGKIYNLLLLGLRRPCVTAKESNATSNLLTKQICANNFVLQISLKATQIHIEPI